MVMYVSREHAVSSPALIAALLRFHSRHDPAVPACCSFPSKGVGVILRGGKEKQTWGRRGQLRG